MNWLLGHRVVALGTAAQSALARFFESLGATVVATSMEDLGLQLADASFLVEDLGLPRLADAGWSRDRLQQNSPRLIHVSITPFGSDAPRGLWLGNELIASAMSGVLRLTGSPDRAPVKEALDACCFHADMVGAAGAMAAHFERGAGAIDLGLGIVDVDLEIGDGLFE